MAGRPNRRMLNNPEIDLDRSEVFMKELESSLADAVVASGAPVQKPGEPFIVDLKYDISGVRVEFDNTVLNVEADVSETALTMYVTVSGVRASATKRVDLSEFLYTHDARGAEALKEGVKDGRWPNLVVGKSGKSEIVMHSPNLSRGPTTLLRLPLNRLIRDKSYSKLVSFTDAEVEKLVADVPQFGKSFVANLRSIATEMAAEVNRQAAQIKHFIQSDPATIFAPPAPKGPEYSVVLTYKGIVLEAIPVETQQDAIDAMTAMQGELRIKTVKGSSSKGAKANPYNGYRGYR